MTRITLLLAAMLLLLPFAVLAKDGKDPKSKTNEADSLAAELFQAIKFRDSVNAAMKYETGRVTLDGGFAQLNIPPGFKFLNATQSNFVVTEVWGNPPRTDILGMIFPQDGAPFADSSYAFIVSFEDMGYVKDEDANDINYDDMLKEMQTEEVEENKQRTAMGYGTIHIAGWAQKPFYDKQKNVLHWAKDLQFDGSEDHTLNYDVRILGRKGVLSLNAVASMSELSMVQRDINKVLGMASFTEGNRYTDFDSNTDKIAVYTIGGLVAGKILAKAGIWALLLKFGKFIIIGLVAVGAILKRFVFGRKKEPEYAYAAEETAETPKDENA